MPASKKPRKPFNAAKHQVMSIMFALADHEKAKLKQDPRVALEAMRTDDGSLILWRTMAVRLNVLTHVVTHGAKDWHEVSRNAGLAMKSAHERFDRTRKWGFSGPEYDAVRLALNTMDDAQDQMTRVELYDAYRAAEKGRDIARKAGTIFVDTFNYLATA